MSSVRPLASKAQYRCTLNTYNRSRRSLDDLAIAAGSSQGRALYSTWPKLHYRCNRHLSSTFPNHTLSAFASLATCCRPLCRSLHKLHKSPEIPPHRRGTRQSKSGPLWGDIPRRIVVGETLTATYEVSSLPSFSSESQAETAQRSGSSPAVKHSFFLQDRTGIRDQISATVAGLFITRKYGDEADDMAGHSPIPPSLYPHGCGVFWWDVVWMGYRY